MRTTLRSSLLMFDVIEEILKKSHDKHNTHFLLLLYSFLAWLIWIGGFSFHWYLFGLLEEDSNDKEDFSAKDWSNFPRKGPVVSGSSLDRTARFEDAFLTWILFGKFSLRGLQLLDSSFFSLFTLSFASDLFAMIVVLLLSLSLLKTTALLGSIRLSGTLS